MPFVYNLAGLGHRLIKARTLLHVDREEDAAKLADEALDIVERTPRMANFRAMALDAPRSTTWPPTASSGH